MKLAFSSVGCPGWDLVTMVEKAKEYGFDGIELRALQGETDLTKAPELATNPAKIGRLMQDTGVELVCLSTSAAFHMTDASEVKRSIEHVRENIELAGQLQCPFVRVLGAEIPKLKIPFLGYQRRESVLARIAGSLRELAPFAASHRVTVLIENYGDFNDSQAMWYLVDAAKSPAVRCCWNVFNARLGNERPTRAVPRLGSRIGMVHVCDGKFGADGSFESYALPGQGQVEIARMIQLLKGIGYRGYLSFEWPRLWDSSLADPDRVFATAGPYLREHVDEQPVPLTAYKNDKFAPNQSFESTAK